MFSGHTAASPFGGSTASRPVVSALSLLPTLLLTTGSLPLPLSTTTG
jgi:hypothetical protein